MQGNHLPEVPDGTSFVGYVITHSFGGSAALTMGYLYNAATRHAPWTANAVNGFPLVGAGRRWGQWLFLLCLPGLPYMVPYMVRTDFGGLVVEIEIFVVNL
jgi:hypothetical protein